MSDKTLGGLLDEDDLALLKEFDDKIAASKVSCVCGHADVVHYETSEHSGHVGGCSRWKCSCEKFCLTASRT